MPMYDQCMSKALSQEKHVLPCSVPEHEPFCVWHCQMWLYLHTCRKLWVFLLFSWFFTFQLVHVGGCTVCVACSESLVHVGLQFLLILPFGQIVYAHSDFADCWWLSGMEKGCLVGLYVTCCLGLCYNRRWVGAWKQRFAAHFQKIR